MTITPFIDLKKRLQPYRAELDLAINRVLDSGVFAGGEEVSTFEKEWAAYLSVQHCIGIGNATDGFELLYRALGIGPGDEVIVPACGLISPAEMASFCGATPVFADVDPVSYNLDPTGLEQLITPRTKAIVCVHLYGHMAPMAAIRSICEKYGIFLIEDCAQAHGAGKDGRKAGALSTAGIYSFYPTKNLGALGDAGALVTNDDMLAARLRELANHGQSAKDLHQREGRNSRLDPIQAAVLRVRLSCLDQENEIRKEHAHTYYRLLEGTPLVIPPQVLDESHTYHLYVVRSTQRDYLQKFLLNEGVGTAIHYPVPVPWQPAYDHMASCRHHLPGATTTVGTLLSLPNGPEHSLEYIKRVGELVSKVLRS
ncbi:MAG: DegT/DnrJ/EryC1/StrS family aminotransferase [Cyclobacteriaceae bacterium]